MNKIDFSKEELSKKIENNVKIHETSYIIATIAVSEIESMEYDIISKLLSRPILEKIQEEGRGLNLLPKSKNKLPFA